MRYICQNKECTSHCKLNLPDGQDRPLYCPVTGELVDFKSFCVPASFNCNEDYCEAEDADIDEVTINGVPVAAHSFLLDEHAVSLCEVLKVTEDRLELYEFGKGVITMSIDDVERNYKPVTCYPLKEDSMRALVGTKLRFRDSSDPTKPFVMTATVVDCKMDTGNSMRKAVGPDIIVDVEGKKYNRYELADFAVYDAPPHWPVVSIAECKAEETENG